MVMDDYEQQRKKQFKLNSQPLKNQLKMQKRVSQEAIKESKAEDDQESIGVDPVLPTENTLDIQTKSS